MGSHRWLLTARKLRVEVLTKCRIGVLTPLFCLRNYPNQAIEGSLRGLVNPSILQKLNQKVNLRMSGSGTDKTKSGWDLTGPVVILVEPQLGENIGMAARAMGNF